MDATSREPGALPSLRGSTPRLTDAVLSPFRDAWLAARARLAVLVALRGAAADLGVEAFRGNVVLYGDVPTRAASNVAERAVRSLPGIVGVSNRLHVRGAQVLRPGTTDAEIRTAVAARLREAPALRGSILTVENVYDGVVRLTGVACDARAASEAFDLAVAVPGVRRVIDDVAPYRPEPAADDDADAA